MNPCTPSCATAERPQRDRRVPGLVQRKNGTLFDARLYVSPLI